MVSISIIVPIYKVEKYIGRCLDSIFGQEDKDISMECILVNDCTPDGSMEIVSQKLKNYKGNISFLIENHKENSGLCAARNTGLNKASGEYVFFVDSDDVLKPKTMRYFLNRIQRYGSDIDVTVGNSWVGKTNEPIIQYEREHLYENHSEYGLRKLLIREVIHTAWNKLIKRKFLIKNQLYFEDGIIDEDLLWSYLVFLHANRVLVLPKITYLYEDNPGSIMNTSSQKMALVIKSRTIICNQIIENPPKILTSEFFMYFFYVLLRAVDLYERNSEALSYLKDDLYDIRGRFLKLTRKKRYFILYLFFLITVKPFYHILSFSLVRRYYDKIAKGAMTLSRFFHREM